MPKLTKSILFFSTHTIFASSSRRPLLNLTSSLSSNAQQQSTSRTSSPAMDSNVFASSTITSLGNCRTCLKRIKENEEHHYCDNCSQIICEDCSSYSSKHQAKVSSK